MKGHLWFVVSGFVFAVGLALSGMTQPDKVIGFLDFTGRWDPSLALVMCGAVAVYLGAYRWTRRRPRPVFAEAFPDPPHNLIDGRLIAGALLFGIGWGLSGFCPGPALVSLGAGTRAALWFVPGMVAGIGLHRFMEASVRRQG
jgi:uncharacterized membrane protein YedE/YeeE